MVEKFVIREMVKGDIKRVHEIERESFDSPWSKALILDELERDFSFNYVICDSVGGDVLGFIIFWIVHDECHILNVAVWPMMRKRGLGERLMRKCEEVAEGKGASYICLEVREGNLAAKNLYRKLGYRFVGLRKGYYSDTGEDGWFMMKNVHREAR